MRAPLYDAAMQLYCALVVLLVLAMLGMALYASFVKFWPYDLSFSWLHYQMGLFDAEVGEGFVDLGHGVVFGLGGDLVAGGEVEHGGHLDG